MIITDSTLWDTLANVAAVFAFLAPVFLWMRKKVNDEHAALHAQIVKLWDAHDVNARRLDEKP